LGVRHGGTETRRIIIIIVLRLRVWYEKKEQLQPANASPQSNNFKIEPTTYTTFIPKLSNNIKSNSYFQS